MAHPHTVPPFATVATFSTTAVAASRPGMHNPPLSLSAFVIVLISSYIAAQMLADVASLKTGIVLGWAVDMGTFIYPITFTLRDMVHRLLGKRSAQVLILTAAGINLLMALYLMAVAAVSSDPLWSSAIGGNVPSLGDAFSALLAPVWRVVLASIVAEVISELLDTEVYQYWSQRFTRAPLWSRVLVSNAVSVPLDTALFCVIAFYGVPQFPDAIIWEIFVFNVIAKGIVTVVSMPLIYVPVQPKGKQAVS